jgi:hypothetical protein
MPATLKHHTRTKHLKSSVNEFKTFKNMFPNMVSMLNDIVNTAALDTPENRNDLGLEAIIKMVASRDKKISDELIAADYFVEILKKIGLTKQMVLQLEKDMPKIVDKIKINRMKPASMNQNGGQSRVNIVLSIWVIFLLLIIQYLLFQIMISPDDLARIQNTIVGEINRIQELNSNCTVEPNQPFNFTTDDERESHMRCLGNHGYITSYNEILQIILDGGFVNRGFSAQDMHVLVLPHGRFFFQNMPMMAVVVGIIAIMNIGAAVFVPLVMSTRYYNQYDVWRLLEANMVTVPAVQPHIPAAAILRSRRLDVDPDADDDAPEEFKDMAFEATIMRDPVVATDGYTYDRSSIEHWFREHATSPMTSLPLHSKLLIPNHSLRSQINEWKTRKIAAADAAASEAAAIKIQKLYRKRRTQRHKKGGSNRRYIRRRNQTKLSRIM